MEVAEQVYDCRAEILRTRMGPAHMTLHYLDQAHVLDLVSDDGKRQYATTGAAFSTDGSQTSAEIDGRTFRYCRLLMANQ